MRTLGRTTDARDVLEVLNLLEVDNGVGWLDGGWGVDALLNRGSRAHTDVDVVVALADVPTLVATLESAGFVTRQENPPTCFVLGDGQGRLNDVHPVSFQQNGDGKYLMENGGYWIYPAAGFTSSGTVSPKFPLPM